MPEIQVSAADGGDFKAYLALPAALKDGAKAPCVIVIQEIFGVNKGIREKCDWLAGQGFIACAPDLFWRIEAGIELSDHIPEQLERAFQLFGEFNIEQGVADIKATMAALRAHPHANGKVGVLGYCLGGKMAYLSACHTQSDASVSYYGVGIENLLADAKSIAAPYLSHIAEEDGFVPKDAQAKIKQGLGGNPLVSLHFYEGMDHAFTREGGDNFNAQAAKLADGRSVSFLKENLG